MIKETPKLEDGVRLSKIIKKLKLNPYQFVSKLEYKSSGEIYNVLEGKNLLSSKIMDKIINKFPNVNHHYLKDGEGEILLDNLETKTNMTKETLKTEDAIRLAKVINELRLNPYQFALKLEYKSTGAIYHVLDGRNLLSVGMMDKIVNKFPNVNYHYLKDGEGDVLLDDSGTQNQINFFNIATQQKNSFVEFSEIPSKLDLLIEQQFKTNELLKKLLENKK